MSSPFMQLYVADYLGDTQHLTTEQHGAYLLLLMAMWRAGGSLPNDEAKLARIARMSAAKWRKVGGDIMDLLDVEGEHVTQKRLAEEYEKAREKSEKRSEAGSKGGKAKALKDNDQGLANASDLPQHSSEPELTIPNGMDAGAPPPDEFSDEREKLFGAGLAWLKKKTGLPERQCRSILGKCLKLTNDDSGRVLRALRGAAEHNVADPVSWVLAELKVKKAPQEVELQGVFIERGTEQWNEWVAYWKAEKGRAPPPGEEKGPDGRMRRGWRFPSEWPPTYPLRATA